MTVLSTVLRRGSAACLLAAVIALAAPAGAALAQAPALSEQDQQVVARVEAYLNGIRTMTSRFVQVAPNGGVAEGMIYLSRPGKMRVEYAPPVEMQIVATGKVLIHYDGELNQPTYLPLGSSPAAFLLEDRIRLTGGDVRVTRVDRDAGRLAIDLAESGNAERGALHLIFTDEPLALREWVVTDAQGKKTRVTLVDPQFGVAIDPVKFLFETPAPKRPDFPMQ